MKSIYTIAAAAMTIIAGSAEAYRDECPTGGYWEEVVRNVRVCDTRQETYTVTHKTCNYNGVLHLGHLWEQPNSYLSPTKFVWDTQHVISTCPATNYKTESVTYWYNNSWGGQSMGQANYTGWLHLLSESSYTTEHTRTVETNCRTEQRTTRVFRCGFEP
ncbi:hypothetical protein J8Z24_19815 [Pseudoalteromonas sp. SCSIO 43201]|uniref:hypothetical protein n=1 Tax=Pseudoalteromonas sp. SCSIO 43201 TaxID=2822842 RepID=UPI002075D4AB|nr:hypothetical protein [Pseudoalteromonas sp. SCSIO 43201]USD30382.1 hypothetical protein J8Z24_19815 [Pseudoalteromonas sp. SCSIO 43201]